MTVTVLCVVFALALGLLVGAMANLICLIMFASEETMATLDELRRKHRKEWLE